MKTQASLISGILLVLGTIFASNRSQGALTVTNGDFSNLSGLTAQGGGWYAGVPAGWNTPVVGPVYTVLNGVANLQSLRPTSPNFHPLYQDLGTTDSLSTITLSFDLSALQGGDYNVGVAASKARNMQLLRKFHQWRAAGELEATVRCPLCRELLPTVDFERHVKRSD